MLVHLDTSILIGGFTGPRPLLPSVRNAVAAGHRLSFSTLVLYEWLRGPRTDEERSVVERQFATAVLAMFGEAEAQRAAALYRIVRRERQRQADLAIAACALEHGARLWTLNPDDFTDIPGLALYTP